MSLESPSVLFQQFGCSPLKASKVQLGHLLFQQSPEVPRQESEWKPYKLALCRKRKPQRVYFNPHFLEDSWNFVQLRSSALQGWKIRRGLQMFRKVLSHPEASSKVMVLHGALMPQLEPDPIAAIPAWGCIVWHLLETALLEQQFSRFLFLYQDWHWYSAPSLLADSPGRPSDHIERRDVNLWVTVNW